MNSILEEGSLIKSSNAFGNMHTNFEEEISPGVLVKDVLSQEVLGSIQLGTTGLPSTSTSSQDVQLKLSDLE